MAARGNMRPKVMICATDSRPYLSATYWITRSRPFTEKSMSISGIDMRSAFRKRSNRRSYSSGSTSVILSAYETIEPAADPRPGPTAIPLSFANLTKSHTIRK